MIAMNFAEGNDGVESSWVQLPGFFVSSNWLQAIVYALALFYLFLGIALVSDIFMK